MKHFIVVSGNPMDGFSYTGPFTDTDEDAAHEKAVTWAERNADDGAWWVVPLKGYILDLSLV